LIGCAAIRPPTTVLEDDACHVGDPTPRVAEALEYFNAGAAAAAERTGNHDGTGAV
jgi:hypothetical protein